MDTNVPETIHDLDILGSEEVFISLKLIIFHIKIKYFPGFNKFFERIGRKCRL
jgi:hypothetical protein